jgi:DNA-binding NarL/FixJ family response regulator
MTRESRFRADTQIRRHAAHNLHAMAARVLIVDDHEFFRSRARKLLESAGYAVVGEAEDAAGAIAQAHALSPDLVFLDVQLPDRDGFAVAAELGAGPDAPRIVLISSREAADYGSRIEAAGTSGFIHKPDLSRARIEQLVGAPG